MIHGWTIMSERYLAATRQWKYTLSGDKDSDIEYLKKVATSGSVEIVHDDSLIVVRSQPIDGYHCVTMYAELTVTHKLQEGSWAIEHEYYDHRLRCWRYRLRGNRKSDIGQIEEAIIRRGLTYNNQEIIPDHAVLTCELSVSDVTQHRRNEPMKIETALCDAKVVGVKFKKASGVYYYRTDYVDLAVGDLVVVNSPDFDLGGWKYTVCKVHEVDCDKQDDLKWIVDQVYLGDHEDNLEKDKALKKLGKKMRAKKNEDKFFKGHDVEDIRESCDAELEEQLDEQGVWDDARWE